MHPLVLRQKALLESSVLAETLALELVAYVRILSKLCTFIFPNLSSAQPGDAHCGSKPYRKKVELLAD